MFVICCVLLITYPDSPPSESLDIDGAWEKLLRRSGFVSSACGGSLGSDAQLHWPSCAAKLIICSLAARISQNTLSPASLCGQTYISQQVA